MLGMMLSCHSPSVLNECLLCIVNEQSEVSECVAGDFPEQQHGEGKCPLTYLCPTHMIINFPHYIFKT
jgi:hypothetical protein